MKQSHTLSSPISVVGDPEKRMDAAFFSREVSMDPGLVPFRHLEFYPEAISSFLSRFRLLTTDRRDIPVSHNRPPIVRAAFR